MRTYRHTVSTPSVTLAVIVVIVAIEVTTTQSYFEEKRDEMQAHHQRPFFMGTRYGRSGPHAPHNVVVAPRNDKFFMGSRYGKRSRPPCVSVPPATVSCRYTGVGLFYRCEPDAQLRNSASDHENSLPEESSMDFVTPANN